MKISAIADAISYGSEAGLNPAFKQQFGTTPAAFRKATLPSFRADSADIV
jgi:AraC-like DNA-binding protein